MEINWSEILGNVSLITSEPLDLADIQSRCQGGDGVCEVDLYFLQQFIKHFDIKRVMELGSGTSTLFLNTLGITAHTFSSGIPDYLQNHPNVMDWHIDEYSVEFLSEIASNYDMYFIDCEHTAYFAHAYYENLLLKYPRPTVIHDFFDVSTPVLWEEAHYLMQRIPFDNIYKPFILTDFPQEVLGGISDIIKYDVSKQKFNNADYGITRPPMCSLFLIPIV
jgi:hypothetical protein